ncbi:hypothetical protein F4679DRAFT_224328 [Xylaria curta]|nr:hypothetical protein F4679DRAFT_224328 [Xylaria curta]
MRTASTTRRAWVSYCWRTVGAEGGTKRGEVKKIEQTKRGEADNCLSVPDGQNYRYRSPPTLLAEEHTKNENVLVSPSPCLVSVLSFAFPCSGPIPCPCPGSFPRAGVALIPCWYLCKLVMTSAPDMAQSQPQPQLQSLGQSAVFPRLTGLLCKAPVIKRPGSIPFRLFLALLLPSPLRLSILVHSFDLSSAHRYTFIFPGPSAARHLPS